MKQVSYLLVFCVLALAACTGSFKKGDNGLEYKIISKGSGKTMANGDYMQFHVTQVYGGTKDTVLQDSRDYFPRTQQFDSATTPPAYYKILRQLKKGDSLVIRMLTDTAFKDSPQAMPPFMKKGKYLYTYVKIVNIFSTKEQADSANKAEMTMAKPKMYNKQFEQVEKEIMKNKQQMAIDDKIISDYLAKNNIKAEKTKWGTYIVVQNEGIGEKMNNTNIASVNYTGRTLDSGKVFDSNVDPKFQHVQPYDVNLTQISGLIYGWTDALLHLKKGSKATIYVPSTLGYGTNGNGEIIKPNDILVFDLEVLDVSTEAQMIAKQEEMQKQMIEAERRRTDSIEKATKK